MNLSRRGFLASIVAVAAGAKLIARGEPAAPDSATAWSVRQAHVETRPWGPISENLTWTDEEVCLDPLDPPGPGVKLSDFIDFVRDTGARPQIIELDPKREDERRESVQRQWRSLWAVPTGSKVA